MIPIVLCIDVEPDGPGHIDPAAGRWSGFVGLHRYLTGLRGPIEDATGHPAVFSWFLRMDPQVTEISGSARHAVDAHPEVIGDIVERGEPLGLHIHGWRRVRGRSWVDDYGDRAWLDQCIGSSHAAFVDSFGRPCRLTRMGGRFLDELTAERLVEQGAVVDLSLEPANDVIRSGGRPTIVGDLPDCRRLPRAPHRLAAGLVELPLSASRRLKGWHPRRHLSRIRYHGLRQRLDLPVQLAREIAPGDSFANQVERTVRGQHRPYLAYALRSDGLVEPGKAARIDGQMHDLLAVATRYGGSFMTPEMALAALDFT